MSDDYLKPGTKILWFEGEDDSNHISVEVVRDDEEAFIVRDEHGKEFDGSVGNYMPPVCTVEVAPLTDLTSALAAHESRLPTKIKAKFCWNVVVTDPDSGEPVEVDIYKMESGGMVGLDASYIENDIGPVRSPYDANAEIELED